MPRGHGKTFVGTDNFVDRRRFSLARRSSVQSSNKFPSKESQMVVPVLRNCEERRIVLTFLTLDDHMWRLLVPFTSFIQGPELRNQHDSQDPVNTNLLDSPNSSYPHPAIFVQFDLKEQSLTSQENPAFSSASVKTVRDYRSSASNVLGKYHRLKRNEFIKDTLSNSLGTVEPAESRLSYGSDCVALSASADVTGKVDKPVKLSSRNKRKKKRKPYKRSMHKKTSIKPENQGEDFKCNASESETSGNGDLVCLAATEDSLSLSIACPKLPVQDASFEVLDQLDIECNNKDCSSRLSSSVGEPLDKNINDSIKPLCLPYKFIDHTNEVTVDVVTSLSNKSYKTSSSTSFQINAEIEMSEDTVDDCETQCSITNDGAFDPLASRMTSTSRICSAEGENKHSYLDNDLSSSCSFWQNDVVDIDCSAERLLDSSQASSSDDFRPVIRSKRGRLARKLSGNSDGMHRHNNSHFHHCSEKDNKHSIWQKVEKPRMSESTYKKNSGKVASQVDISLNCMETKVKSKQLTELQQSKIGKSLSTMDGRSTCTYLEKLHRKPNLDAELETQSACHSSINNINVPSKIQVSRKEKLATTVEFTKISHLTDNTNSSLTKNMNPQTCILQKATNADNICSILHDTSPSQGVPSSSLMVNLNSDSRTSNNFGPLLQKCCRSPRQELMITKSQIVSQENSSIYEPAPSSLISGFTDKFLSSNSHGSSFLSTCETQGLRYTTGYMDCSSYEEDELIRKLDNQPCTSSEEPRDFPSPSGCQLSQALGNEHLPHFVTDLTKISEAVDESYKLLVAAEDIQRATGGPLAEFEKILRSASPLIEMDCINLCNTCSQNRTTGESLSFHQVPNISLKNLWQWYEKPGSYGLEVKVDDLCTSNRSRIGLSKFCAYFVPYLSAVQLFAQSRRSIFLPDNDIEGDFMETCEVCKTSKSLTSLASLPIFSKLLPRGPRLHSRADTGSAKHSSTTRNEEFSETSFSELLTDELLFEYFDSDQPQQRKPLFDKIQELIQGNSSSNCHFYGDSSKLGCLNLKELHPASWYAVAWYPIYRIPDGSFRAAFLTYHSFGHFVSSSISSTEGCTNFLISPVVGLQSYNAKGECWFEPKNLNFREVHTDAASSENASQILIGRLQSLERTAYAMSRATVRKGNQKITNRHPDYEFFLSRSR